MIVSFSGCGNSRDVAGRIAGLLGDERHVKLEATELQRCSLGSCADNRVVWVMPVYSWGVPPIVADYIQGVELDAPDAVHYLVITCGDDIGLADRQWRSLVERRGWRSAGAWSVQMPNTYTLMKGFDVDSPQLAEEKLADSVARVEEIADKIASGSEEVDVVRGSYAWIKSKVVFLWFRRFAMSPKPFHATDACVSCGLCSRQCPLTNIAMGRDRRPHWGNHCALCLRCYHICPHHAVAYGKATRNKGQYLNPSIQ